MLAANTLYDKLWNSHVVLEENGHPAVLYVDLQWLHDGTFRRAFELLEERGLSVARPAQNIAVTDHCLPTVRPLNPLPPVVSGLVAACKRHGIRVFGPQDSEQGIVHIIGPEQGLTLPGMTVICADSHTTTHGALGALSLVVGTTQTLHALSTQCVLQRRAKTMRINLEGSAQRGVTAKDVVLALIRRHGIAVASGFAIEYSGTSVRAMSIAQRMTLCNMGAELGARTALIAPDEKTFEYLEGRRFSPQAYAAAVERWRHLRSDEGARFDAEIAMDVRDVAPMVTWGTTPEMAISVDEPIPSPRSSQESEALRYMGFKPGLTPKIGRAHV